MWHLQMSDKHYVYCNNVEMVAAKSSNIVGASTFTANSGFISSPNFPEPYTPYEYLEYVILPPALSTIKLQFLEFRLPSDGYSYLDVCVMFLYLRLKQGWEVGLTRYLRKYWKYIIDIFHFFYIFDIYPISICYIWINHVDLVMLTSVASCQYKLCNT